MKAGPWVAVLEAFLVKKLLESPAFHKAIGKAHKRVHQMRHGIPPEEMGGTKIDAPPGSGFLNHFLDELRGQANVPAKRPSNRITSRPPQSQAAPRPQPHSQSQSYSQPKAREPHQSQHRPQEQNIPGPDHSC